MSFICVVALFFLGNFGLCQPRPWRGHSGGGRGRSHQPFPCQQPFPSRQAGPPPVVKKGSATPEASSIFWAFFSEAGASWRSFWRKSICASFLVSPFSLSQNWCLFPGRFKLMHIFPNNELFSNWGLFSGRKIGDR